MKVATLGKFKGRKISKKFVKEKITGCKYGNPLIKMTDWHLFVDLFFATSIADGCHLGVHDSAKLRHWTLRKLVFPENRFNKTAQEY